MDGVKVHASVSGSSMREDIRLLKRGGIQVVGGTSGSVRDMIERRLLSLKSLRQVKLDEADETLSGGFRDKIFDILPVPPRCGAALSLFGHRAFGSARYWQTLPSRSGPCPCQEGWAYSRRQIKQFYIAVGHGKWKLEKLCDVYESVAINQAIVFCNTRHRAKELQEDLTKRDFTVSYMHGDLEQSERDLILRELTVEMEK